MENTDLEAVEFLKEARQKLIKEIEQVIVGQHEVIDQLLMALFSRGHCLLIGVPGLAKTLLVSTLARILDLEFNRIQFTPDLMPSDIIGTEIIQDDKATGERNLRFLRGPVFANVVLADEINRAPAKVQSALLEAMQERQVTFGGITHSLPRLFFVMATQNPIEQEGTYPLPEAQIDRFVMKLIVDYPTVSEEVEILQRMGGVEQPSAEAVMSPESVIELQQLAASVVVEKPVLEYMVRLVSATRNPKQVGLRELAGLISYGASPRGSLSLLASSRARALTAGMAFVTPDLVKDVALDVLRHRIIRSFEAEAEEVGVEEIIDTILNKVPVK